MKVSVIEQDGEPQIMSVYHALTGLPDDADLFMISADLCRGRKVHVRRHGVKAILAEAGTLPAPVETGDQPAQQSLALLDRRWEGDITVHLELDVKAYCNAPTAEQAVTQIEETMRGLAEPRPDFRLELDKDSVDALLLRLDIMRTPRDLAPAAVILHRIDPLEPSDA